MQKTQCERETEKLLEQEPRESEPEQGIRAPVMDVPPTEL